MCSNYFPTVSKERLTTFGVQPVLDLTSKHQVWKSYAAPMVRNGGDGREILLGEFGLLPFWSKERKIKYSTFNARSETVESASSFKTPWARGQRCIIPADWVVEPDWRTGRSIPTAISRADGEPMGLAGLWDKWLDETTGEVVHSFTMLTINADSHGLMRNYHRILVAGWVEQIEEFRQDPLPIKQPFKSSFPLAVRSPVLFGPEEDGVAIFKSIGRTAHLIQADFVQR